MKAIHLSSAIIGTISSRSKNNGIGFRVTTPELTSEQRTAFFDLQDVVCNMLIQPVDEEFPDVVEVKSEVERKTPSSRLRGSLFVLWQKRGSDGDFDVFYRTQMEKFIDRIKTLIDAEEE